MQVATVVDLLGGKKTIKKNISNRMELLNLARGGILTGALGAVQANTHLTMRELTSALPVSSSTLHRQTKKKRFDPLVSEKLIELAEFWSRGLDVFSKSENFTLWLHNPCIALGGIEPISLINSSIGLGILKDELGRMEHGIVA